MRIGNLVKNQKSLAIPMNGETLNIAYQPGKITPAAEDQLREMIAEQRGGTALASLLSEMILSWDLTDDGDQPFPIDDAHLRQLPTSFLAEVANAITEDMRPNAPSAGTSGAG